MIYKKKLDKKKLYKFYFLKYIDQKYNNFSNLFRD